MFKKLHFRLNLMMQQNLTLTKKLVWFLFFALFTNIAMSQVTISPWKMNRGEGAIEFSLTNHGNPAAYTKMNIPDAANSNWSDAPVNANGEINFSERSILSRCLQQLDFTYFQTFISIPTGYTVNNINVSFSAADDGARAYIFNSANPNGAYIGEIGLGGAGTSTNYASLAKAGETNRLVIVQFDDCPTGNNLTGAKVNVNGQAAPINTGGCTQSNFFWSNAPTISGNTASGTINGIGYTYTSTVNVRRTSNMFSHSTFPASYNVPNANPTIQNIEPSSNTLTFASPMTNPVLVFSSIGAAPVSVPINFSAPVDVLWSTHVGAGSSFVQNSPTQITGREAYVIVRMNGTFSSISFDYLTYENYVNFAFGADFSTNYPDTVAPTLTLNGNSTATVNTFATYTDPGANATDNCDTNPAVLVSGSVDTNTPGNYTLTYTAVDASGNTSAPLTRVVTVVTPCTPVSFTNINLYIQSSTEATSCQATVNYGLSVLGTTPSVSYTFTGATVGTGTGTGTGQIFNKGITHVTVNATNSCNTSSTSFDITVVDDVKPIAKTKPVTLYLGANGKATLTASDVNNGSSDNCAIDTYTLDTSGTICATAAEGNSLTLTAPPGLVITGIDFASYGTPTGSCGNFALGSCHATNSLSIVSSRAIGQNSVTIPAVNSLFGDPCGGTVKRLYVQATYGVKSPSLVYDCNNLGTNTVNLIVTDTNGNVSSATATVTVVDAIAPVITLNGNATETVNAYAPYTDAGATASDNCGTPTVTVGGAVDVNTPGVYILTYDAVDASSNAATQVTRTVTVVDVTPPTVITKNITVYLDNNGSVSITPQQIDNGSTDNSGVAPTLSLDKTEFSCSDVNNEQAAKYALQLDGQNDYLTMGNFNGALNNASQATYQVWVKVLSLNNSYASVVEANNGSNLWLSMEMVSATGQLGMWVSGGNVLTQNRVINIGEWVNLTAVYDGTQPQVQNRVKIYVNGVLQNLGYVGPIPSSTLGNIQDIFLGSQRGTTQFSNIVYDEARIWGRALSTAEVQANWNQTIVGNEAGLLGYYSFEDGPGSTTITELTGNQGVGNLNNMDPNTAWVTGADGLSQGGTGTLVTLTATDGNNNSASATAIVTVVDNIAPVITAPANISVFATSAAGAVVNYTAPVGTDNCSVTTALTTVGFGSGATFPIGTTVVTYTATDGSGNTASTSFNVEVVGIAPVLGNMTNITVSNDPGICAAVVNYVATETVVGIPAATITYSIAPGSTFAKGTATVTATATNAIGSSSVSFDVIVNDTEKPTVTTRNITVELDANGAASITAAQINNGSSDNCAVASIALDITSFTCDNLGANTVTLTVTDGSNNSSSATAIVTVVDKIAPTVITKNFSIPLANGVANITASDINNGSFDNCEFTLSIDKNTFTCDDIGDHTVTLTATDSSGNKSSKTAVVTVIGDTPVITIANFNAVETQQGNTIFLGFGPQSMALVTTATGGDSFTYVWTASNGDFVSNVANPVISPTSSATYTVTATNNYGCTTTATIEVCVMDVRSYDKKGKATDKVVVCHHTNGKKGTQHVTIEISKNAVMQHLTLHGANTGHGDRLGDCNATCISSNPILSPIVNNDSENLLNSFDFTIYPNPSRGAFQIKLSNYTEDTEVYLLDISGKIIERKSIKVNEINRNIQMNETNLPSGVYLLKVISNEKTVTKKVIIQKE